MSVRSVMINIGANAAPLIAQANAGAAAVGRLAAAEQTLKTRQAATAASMAKTSTQAAAMGRAVGAAGAQVGGFAGIVGGLNPALIGGAGLVMALRQTVGASIRFEHEFANVRKTVEGTPEELAKVADQIRGLSKEMPATTTELNAIASAAGQLGVATDNLAEFTAEMAMVGVATDMTSDQAAMNFARLATITGTPIENIRELTSTTVALGNRFAAQEGEIVNFALRIAGAGTQVGMTNDQILALSTALPAMGLRAEMGGSSISRILVEIANAVDMGGDKLAEFARVSGMSVEQFSTAFRDDAANALLVFLEGLQQAGAAGESTFQIIDELGLANIRTQDTLLRGASAAEFYARSLSVAGDEVQRLTALEDEYATFANTTHSQWQIFKNNVKDLAISIGEDLQPVVDDLLTSMNNLFAGPSGGTKRKDVSVDDFVSGADRLGGQGLFGWFKFGDAAKLADELRRFETDAGQAYLEWLAEAARGGDKLATETLTKLRSEFEGQSDALHSQVTGYLATAEGVRQVDQYVAWLTGRSKEGADATGDLADGIDGVGESAFRTAEGIYDLNAHLDALIGVHLGAEKAAIRVAQGWDDLTEGLKGGTDALDLATEKGRENRTLMSDQAAAIQALIEERYAESGSISEALTLYDDLIAKYQTTATEAGLTEAQVAELIEQYGLTPEQVITRVLAETGDALDKLTVFQSRLERLTGKRWTVTVDQRLGRVVSQGPGMGGITENHVGGWAGQGRPHTGDGLGPNEVPIIALRDEYILPPWQSRLFADMGLIPRRHTGGYGDGQRSSTAVTGDLARVATAIERATDRMERLRAAEQRESLTGRVSDAERDVRQAKTADARATANRRLAEARQAVARYDRDAARQAELAALQDEQARLQTELRAAEEREALELRIRDNRREYLLSSMTVEEQLGHLDRRISAERAFTDEWMQLVARRQQIAQQEADTLRRNADTALADLNRMLDDRERVLEQMAQAEDRHAKAVADAQQRARDAIQSTVDARAQALRQSLDLGLGGDAWAWQAGSIADQLDRQTANTAAWREALGQLRSGGVSDAAIGMLGLDAGPEMLRQAQVLLRSSNDELARLPEAAARREAEIQQTVAAERLDGRSQLARDIAQIERDLNDELAGLRRDHNAEMAKLGAELAAIGLDTGRDYATSIADGIASGIPAIEAQVARVQQLMRDAKAAEAAAGTTVPTTIAGQAAALRASLGLPADPESDAKWQRWITEGSRTHADMDRRLREAATSYDSGGWLQPGYTLAYNGTGRPEPVGPVAQQTQVVVVEREVIPAGVVLELADGNLGTVVLGTIRNREQQLADTLGVVGGAG